MIKVFVKHKVFEFAIDILFQRMNNNFKISGNVIKGRDLRPCDIGCSVSKIISNYCSNITIPPNTFILKLDHDTKFDPAFRATEYYYYNHESVHSGIIHLDDLVYF